MIPVMLTYACGCTRETAVATEKTKRSLTRAASTYNCPAHRLGTNTFLRSFGPDDPSMTTLQVLAPVEPDAANDLPQWMRTAARKQMLPETNDYLDLSDPEAGG